jgi:hypothetical protein
MRLFRLLPFIVTGCICALVINNTSFAEIAVSTCNNCTHDELLTKYVSAFPDGSLVPVIVLFKNQLTPEEIKAQMTINSTGRFDIRGEVKLIESYGGKINPTNISLTNFLVADVPKDKVFSLQKDPQVLSIDSNSPISVAVTIPRNESTHYRNNTVNHISNFPANFTSFPNSTNNTNTNTMPLNNTNEIAIKDTLESKIMRSSPLKQLESGILVKNIQCNEGYILLVKMINGHPSCVRHSSEKRLLANGWITLESFDSRMKG